LSPPFQFAVLALTTHEHSYDRDLDPRAASASAQNNSGSDWVDAQFHSCVLGSADKTQVQVTSAEKNVNLFPGLKEKNYHNGRPVAAMAELPKF
jgi:hypothetical protein